MSETTIEDMLANGNSTLTDEQVVERVLSGDIASFEIIMRRYNQRLYRIALGMTRDSSEAEDVVQDTYVRAYEHLRQFSGLARFSTWLAKIAVHEANRRRKRSDRYETFDEAEAAGRETRSDMPNPEQDCIRAQIGGLLETAIESLPEHYRAVFLMREVEGLSAAECAEILELSEETVRIRSFRARGMLRRFLMNVAGAAMAQAFPLHAPRCNRIVAGTFARITPSADLSNRVD